jgi:hypothetical protein
MWVATSHFPQSGVVTSHDNFFYIHVFATWSCNIPLLFNIFLLFNDIHLWMVLIFSIESFEFFSMTLHLLDGFFQLKFRPFPMPMFLTKKTSIVKKQIFFCWWWFLVIYVLLLLSPRLFRPKLLFGSRGLNLMCYLFRSSLLHVEHFVSWILL